MIFLQSPHLRVRNPRQKQVLVAIGARIAAKRAERKMSQAELGLEIGVGEKQIRRIEGGQHSVNILMLLMVGHVLKLDFGDLLNGLTDEEFMKF